MGTPDSDRHDLFLRLFVEHEAALRGFVRALVPMREDAKEVLQEVAAVVILQVQAVVQAAFVAQLQQQAAAVL